MRTAKVPLAVETGANLEVQPLLPGKVREHLSRAAIGRSDGRHQSDGVDHGGKLEQRVEHGDAKPPATGALMNGDLPHEHCFRVVDKAIARYTAHDVTISLGQSAGFCERLALCKVVRAHNVIEGEQGWAQIIRNI